MSNLSIQVEELFGEKKHSKGFFLPTRRRTNMSTMKIDVWKMTCPFEDGGD